MLLQNQVAIITGAGSGMGKAIALSFANEGAIVAVADINLKAAEETAWLIQEQNGEAYAIDVDVSNARSVKALIETVVEKESTLDIVVNCAGIPQAFTLIEDLGEEQWDRLFSVNTKSAFLTAKYAVPYMKEQNQGVILNISSIAAERPRPGLNAYCASKGAIVALTKALAIELAPFRIRVNAVNPGPTDTGMLGKFIPDHEGRTPQQKRELFLSSIPFGKLIEPEDIAQSALYLCSSHAQNITGAILNVDGGRGV